MPVERLTVCPLCNDTKLVWRGSPERGDWEDCDCVTKGDAWVDAFPRIATGKQLIDGPNTSASRRARSSPRESPTPSIRALACRS
jgi:hypothetical protein